MAEAKAQRKNTIALQMVRLSFPKLWKPEASVEGGPLKYGASFLIDPDTKTGKDNIALIEATLKKLGVETWAEKSDKVMRALDTKRKAFVDGEDCTNSEGDVYDGYEGMKVVKANNAKRFKILERDKSPILEDNGRLYAGCYCDAIVSFFPITDKAKGGNGIFASLELVRFRKDGDAFGAPPVDEDDYLDDLDEDEDDDMI